MTKGPGPSLFNQSILDFGESALVSLFNDKEDLRVIEDTNVALQKGGRRKKLFSLS